MAANVNGWVGNIGSDPEFREFANGNDVPRRLVRLNVYFDNPVPDNKGGREDRGGFWMAVEWWHRDAEQYAEILQKGMRVTVAGRQVKDTWKDRETQEEKSSLKIQATQISINLHRIESVTMAPKQPPQGQSQQQAQQQTQTQQQAQSAAGFDSYDDDIPY